MMPLKIAFEDSVSNTGIIIDMIIDSFFMIDVLLTFFTGYRDTNEGGMVVLNPRKIAMRYLKTWFIIDLTASFPWQLLEILTSINNFLYLKLLRIFRLLQLLKYFKLIKTKSKRKCLIN